MELNLYYIKWHGKACEISKAPVEALIQWEQELGLKELNSPRHNAILKEIEKRKEQKKP